MSDLVQFAAEIRAGRAVLTRRILAGQPNHAQVSAFGAALSQQGNHTDCLRFVDAAMQIERESASKRRRNPPRLVARGLEISYRGWGF